MEELEILLRFLHVLHVGLSSIACNVAAKFTAGDLLRPLFPCEAAACYGAGQGEGDDPSSLGSSFVSSS